MTQVAKKNTVGMDDYSDIEPMNRKQASHRHKRSVAIASILGFLVILFYITTITRLSENIKKKQASLKKASDITVAVPAPKK